MITQQELAEKIRHLLEAELGDAYDAIRVWEAWGVGTMTEDDFIPVTDRVDKIATALAGELASQLQVPVPEGVTDHKADVGMYEIWIRWRKFYTEHFRSDGIKLSMADQQAFYEIAQPIMRDLTAYVPQQTAPDLVLEALQGLANAGAIDLSVSPAVAPSAAEVLTAERDEARHIVREIFWMALRYADGRNTYAPTQVNEAVKKGYDAGWLVHEEIGDKVTPKFARDPLDGPGLKVGMDFSSREDISAGFMTENGLVVWSIDNHQMPAMYSEVDDEMGPAKFYLGQQVEKFTGDYKAKGEIRGFFLLHDKGPFRYVVRHAAEGGGFFCHIYGAKNLRPVDQGA